MATIITPYVIELMLQHLSSEALTDLSLGLTNDYRTLTESKQFVLADDVDMVATMVEVELKGRRFPS